MIRINDLYGRRYGEVVKGCGDKITVKFMERDKIYNEVLDRVEFFGDIKASLLRRIFTTKVARYEAISSGGDLGV